LISEPGVDHARFGLLPLHSTPKEGVVMKRILLGIICTVLFWTESDNPSKRPRL